MSMSWIEASLSHLEARLREFFEGEGRVEGILPKFHRQLSMEICAAMKTGLRKVPDEREADNLAVLAPDQYTLLLPSQQAEQVLNHPAELDRLTRKIESLAVESGIRFLVAPILHVVADPAADKIRVVAEYSRRGERESRTMEVDGAGNADGVSVANPPKAFLIVNGLVTHTLTLPVINLGRDAANEVHLADPRVSRMHAQLRFIQGRYVIFDLDSTGGTFVNGVAISSHVLAPGDVILLAGVPLVYGVDAEQNYDYTQKMPASPPSPEVL
jgi:hypothetical protein